MVHEMLDLSLDVATFDPAPWQGVVVTVQRSGIRLSSLADEPDLLGAQRAIWTLDFAASADVPEWSGEVTPFDVYQAEHFGGDGYDPEGVLLAWDGARLVGMVGSRVTGEGVGHTWFLAVDRAYRGRAIGMALKLLTIAWAVRRQLRRLETNNNAASKAIVQLNLGLGYVVTGRRTVDTTCDG